MRKLQRALAIALIVPLVLVLSSCMRLRTEFTIHNLEKVDISMDVGAKKDQLDQLGGSYSPDSLCSEASSSADLGKGNDLKLEPYDDGTYIGCKISGSGPIEENNALISFDESKKEWTFTMANSNVGEAGSLGANMVEDFEVKVTFPGEVLTASGSGQISGNTVTWTDAKDMFSADGLKATASNTPAFPWLWILIGVAVVAVAAVVVVLVLKRKKQPAGPPQPGPQGGYYQGQPGSQGGYY
ncbi:MAG: hypothetical protein Q4D79_11215, partial [Propionibacteriaceae bacterium]|nr:hypothetical protein [Propionibacteriaceae bacterium]